MPVRINIIGHRFGRLLVQSDMPKEPGVRRRVQCVCDCGVVIFCEPRALRYGDVTSCGCYHREIVSESSKRLHTTHGMSRKREYNIWNKLRARCKNPNNAKYAEYGGRGIKVCQSWDQSFQAFLADMGLSPGIEYSIDRLDVDGDYEPGNCRWALPIEQARNKRYHRIVEFNGEEMPLSQACEFAGANYRTALYRLNRGQDWLPLPPPPEDTE